MHKIATPHVAPRTQPVEYWIWYRSKFGGSFREIATKPEEMVTIIARLKRQGLKPRIETHELSKFRKRVIE